jgi:two-component system CheB/CheR fusion protein
MFIRPLGHSLYPKVTGLSAGSRLLRYGVAVIAVGLATLLGLYLRPFSYTTPFLFFYPAVIIAVWIGGLKPGLLATVLASVSANFFFLAPYNAFSTDVANLLRTFFFGLTFASICWLADLARKNLHSEAVAAKELAEKTLAQFRANIDSMSEGMYVVDTDGKRLLTNPAYFRILGFDPGSSPDALSPLLERYDMNDKLIPAEDWSVSRALRGETVVQRQLRVRRSDTGREVIVRVNATPVRDSSGNVTMAVGTVEDITAMKQAEESLRTSEKLAAVGRMAGTLAHEINNPLDAVNNLVYLLSQDLKLDEHGHECVQLLQRELERMQQIVANTLSFYRDSSSPVQVNLSQVLDSVLTLDARKIDRKRLQVRKRIEGNVSVMGFPGELRQVFLNLVSNAIEATPDEGTLRIHIFPSKQWQKEEVQGVRVVIADNGHGISSEQRSKLFQPFFTTKGEEGTGLGLWVSQGIVRKHQGEICLRSTTRFGRSGTCFSVFLPIELPEANREKTTAKLAS